MRKDYKNCVFCLKNPACNHECCHHEYPDYEPDLEKIKEYKERKYGNGSPQPAH